MSLLGIDIGTSCCKASLFGDDGTMIHCARRRYELLRDATGGVALPSEEVWRKICEVIAEAAAAGKDSIRALCAASMGEAVVPFDAAGRNYFRKQIRLLEKFCFALARQGIDEESFRRDYLPMEFIRDLVRRIRRSEEKAAELGRARAAAAKREEKKVQRYSLSL